MKKTRRVEITAFRHRISSAQGGQAPHNGDVRVLVNDVDPSEAIEVASDEGQGILIEAVRILEDRIARR